MKYLKLWIHHFFVFHWHYEGELLMSWKSKGTPPNGTPLGNKNHGGEKSVNQAFFPCIGEVPVDSHDDILNSTE